MIRKRVPYEPSKTVLDFSCPTDYVKNVLDSRAPEYKGGYETAGHVLLVARYSNLKDEEQRKLIAKAITELLDDPDYFCDAIPVASELGLSEAKEWFWIQTKKTLETLKQIKTNSYVNLLGCLEVYSDKQTDFLSYIKTLIYDSELTTGEKVSILFRIGNHDPSFIIDYLEKHINEIIINKNEQRNISNIRFITSGIFKKYGDQYCIDLAKRFKESLSKEHQVLYYKALETNGKKRFHEYLEEVKCILHL